jgi:hypothetical protein
VAFQQLGSRQLFSERALSDLIRSQLDKAEVEVVGKDPDELLTIPVEDQVDIVVAHFGLVVPVLREDLAYSEEPQETKLTVLDYGRQVSVPATKYRVRIPFEGDTGLLRHSPTGNRSICPVADIEHREIIINLIGYRVTADDLNKEIDNTVSNIRKFLALQGPQAEACNKQMRERARANIEARRARLLESKSIAASLRYPLKRRSDAPLTYVSSELRRSIASRAKTPASSRQSFIPEPTIDEVDYQHILKVMGDMALMMERSPRTFAKLQEEEIRDHFLLQLNGHYEGSATGETFNAAGKTDILVRDGDKNLFIGECKIWEGNQKLLDAIDQLLGYLTWRDTKSALIIFSRNKNFTAVIQSIRSCVEKHPHKKRGPQSESETRFRYVFGNPEDHNREIIVTIMAFSVLSALT